MTALIVVVTLTLMVSALCSLFEAVLFSTRLSGLEAARESGRRSSRLTNRMIAMKRHVSAPIAAILILNTVANTAGATIAGMYCAEILGHDYILVFSAGLTLGILFISEIIPKTYGAVHWRGLWPFTVWPIYVIRVVLTPFVWLTQHLTHLITHGQPTPVATEEEILAMMNLSASEGQITREENRMVQNIINMEDKRARDIMTPRTVMSIMDASLPLADALKVASDAGFSRFPVFEGDPENITGYVLLRDLYAAAAENPDQNLLSALKPIDFVPETANCLTLLNNFLKHRRHIAMVTDEYGGVAGLLTLEDLIETVLGSEIVDETDRATDLQALARLRNESAPRNGG